MVFGGDFNLFFEAKLEAQGKNPVLKKIFSKTNTDNTTGMSTEKNRQGFS